jgi:hypothetical protein
MKRTEDDTFLFTFTFIEAARDKGFVTHYRPKHPPLSSELASVFTYLGLREFETCPEFDFEPCHFRTLVYQSRGDGIFDSNTEYAHRAFDAHAEQFSSAIQSLLASNLEMEKIGLTFLPLASQTERLKLDFRTNVIRPSNPVPTAAADEPSVPERAGDAREFLILQYPTRGLSGNTRISSPNRSAPQVTPYSVTISIRSIYGEKISSSSLTRFSEKGPGFV